MRKFIVIFSVFLLFVSILLIVFFVNKDNSIEEKTYSLKTSYAYLSDGEVEAVIKIYSNDKNSILKYADKAQVSLHDKSEENVLSVDVIKSYISNNTIYKEETFYEYSLILKVNISNVKITECYMTLKFSNKAYTFYIGSLEIKENIYKENKFKIVGLYGVSSRDNISLAGIVLTIKNDEDKNIVINNIYIGENYQVLLNQENINSVKDSSVIEDYYQNDQSITNFITFIKGETTTFILPIKYLKNQYLNNCYMLFEIDNEIYYLSNYNYINSNDLEGLEIYLLKGLIYDI